MYKKINTNTYKLHITFYIRRKWASFLILFIIYFLKKYILFHKDFCSVLYLCVLFISPFHRGLFYFKVPHHLKYVKDEILSVLVKNDILNVFTHR